MNATALLVSIFFFEVHCSRILIVFPMAGRSHYILGNALARELAEAGHDVTMVSPFEEKNPPKKGKYRDVVLTGLDKDHNKPKILASLLDLESMHPVFYIPMINTFGNEMTRRTMTHPNFQKLLESNMQFDVVIIEQFNNEALKVLAYHYKAPLIMFSTIGANLRINPLVGNPSPPSYIPHFSMDYTSNLTFWERLMNLLVITLSELNRHFIFFPAQNKIMHQYFPHAPDLSEIAYNISLVLINSHESVNQPVPYVPNMISIGGFHVNLLKKLPKDLQDFMDNAKEGVIYFSMGSNIKPSQITENQRKAIVNAFCKVRQKVLWKWDEKNFNGRPDNVKLSKWFPQSEILAHPNTKVFITHGGQLSITEAIYHGVPVLVFPIFADQKMNARRAEMDGYGLRLKFSEATEETISLALEKLLNDFKYKKNAKKLSKLMHDRPIKPTDLAVYWTEFVIRNRGAPHLRVVGVDLPWYKYLLLDVMVFIILTGLCSLIIFYLIIRETYLVISGRVTRKLKIN